MGVYYIGSIPCSGGDIYHFGRKGMKWGQTIFGDLADRLAKRGWTGASNIARGISTGFGRANEFINADQARANLQRSNRMGPTYQMDTATRNAAQAAYNRTLPGMAENARQKAQEAMAKAREKVSTAYADAAAAIGRKGLDIQSFYSQVMEKAKGAINDGKDMVRQFGGTFVSQIQDLGSKVLEGGKNFLTPILNRAKDAGKNVREFATGERARANLQRSNRMGPTYQMDTATRNAAQAAYDRTLPGMIEKVGRGARGAADRVRDTVNDVGDRVSSTAKTAGRKAKKAKRDATDYITGNRSRYELNRAKAAERGANTQHRLASMYDYEDVDNNGSVLNRASRDDYYARERRAQAQAAYDKTLPGQIEKAKKKRKK